MRRPYWLWFAAGLAVGIVAAGHLCRAQEPTSDGAERQAPAGGRPEAVLARARELKAERSAVLAELVGLLGAGTEAEVPSKQREEALLLIGDLHMSTPGVVAALVRDLYVPTDSRPAFVTVPPPFRQEFPAFGALAKIGLPAIPPLMDEIVTAEDPVHRRYAAYFLGSLLGSYAEPRLSHALEGAQREQTKARLEEALERGGFRGVGAYSRRTWFFKRLDQTEPWYYQPPDA